MVYIGINLSLGMVRARNIVFGIAVFILTLFVGMYGISTLYGESPRYDDFCSYESFDEQSCTEEGGVWIENEGDSGPKRGYCQYDYRECQDSYGGAQEKYYKKVFLTALPVGLAIIFLGAMVFGLEAVGAGLMLGGVALMIYGSGAYWRFTDDWLKFVLSLVGLVVVIYVAYWFNRKDKKFWKKVLGK